MIPTLQKQSRYETPRFIFWVSNVLRIIGIFAMVRISFVAIRDIRLGAETDFGIAEPVIYVTLAILLSIFATTDVVMMYRRNTRLARNLEKSVSTQREVVSKVDTELLTNRREISMWVHGVAQSATVRARTEITHDFEVLMRSISDGNTDAATSYTAQISRTKDRVDGILHELLTSLRQRARELWPEHRELPLFPALQKILGSHAQLQLSPELQWTDDAKNLRDGTNGEKLVREFGVSKVMLAGNSRYEIVRVVEEAVNNARKHGATRLEASVILIDNRIRIEIWNDGRALEGEWHPGLGLVIIDEIVKKRQGTYVLKNHDDGVLFSAEFAVEKHDLKTVISQIYGAIPQA